MDQERYQPASQPLQEKVFPQFSLVVEPDEQDWQLEALKIVFKEGDFDVDLEITACQRAALEFSGPRAARVEHVAQFLTHDLEHYFLEYLNRSSLEMYFLGKGELPAFETSLKRAKENSQNPREALIEKIWHQKVKKLLTAPEGTMMAWVSPPLSGLNYSFLYLLRSEKSGIRAIYLRNDFSNREYGGFLKTINPNLDLENNNTLTLVQNPVVFPQETKGFLGALELIGRIRGERPVFEDKKMPGETELKMAQARFEQRIAYQFPQVRYFSQAVVQARSYQELKQGFLEAGKELYNFYNLRKKQDKKKLKKAVLERDYPQVFELMGISADGSCPSMGSDSLSPEAQSLVAQGTCPLCGERLENGYCSTCNLRFK